MKKKIKSYNLERFFCGKYEEILKRLWGNYGYFEKEILGEFSTNFEYKLKILKDSCFKKNTRQNSKKSLKLYSTSPENWLTKMMSPTANPMTAYKLFLETKSKFFENYTAASPSQKFYPKFR